MKNLHKELFEEGFLSRQHFELIDAIQHRRIVSLYHELRWVLYLGIMLFSGGVGTIVYQNIGDLGHLALMLSLFIAIGVCLWWIQLKSKPYTYEEVTVDVIYFDYLVVLVCLLIISLFTYVQVYFDLVDLLLRWTSLVSAVLFLFMAYRYDNKMVLSLGIVALAAVFGLSISPIDWANGEWLEGQELYVLSLFLGVGLLAMGQGLALKGVKRHFTFTIHNFGWLLFYFGALAFLFDHEENVLYSLILMLVGLVVARFYWKQRTFLFFIYASIAVYIVFFFLPVAIGIETIDWAVMFIWLIPGTLIGAILLLIKHRKHFSDENE